jgi:hypothetical protein
MKSLSKPHVWVPAAIFVVGVVIVWGSSVVPELFYLLIPWLAVGNLIMGRLRCKECGKKLIETPSGFVRGFGLGKCAFCGKHQE